MKAVRITTTTEEDEASDICENVQVCYSILVLRLIPNQVDLCFVVNIFQFYLFQDRISSLVVLLIFFDVSREEYEKVMARFTCAISVIVYWTCQ